MRAVLTEIRLEEFYTTAQAVSQYSVNVLGRRKTLDLVIFSDESASKKVLAIFEIKWNASESVTETDSDEALLQTEVYKNWLASFENRHPHAAAVYLTKMNEAPTGWVPLSWYKVHAFAHASRKLRHSLTDIDVTSEFADFLKSKGQGFQKMTLGDAQNIPQIAVQFDRICQLLVRIGMQASKELEDTRRWRFHPGNSPTTPAAQLVNFGRFALWMGKTKNSKKIVWALYPIAPPFVICSDEQMGKVWLAVWLQADLDALMHWKDDQIDLIKLGWQVTDDLTCLAYKAIAVEELDNNNFDDNIVKYASEKIVELARIV